MELEDGKTYERACGQRETVVASTARRSDWVYTTRGNWYERSTGRFIMFSRCAEYPVDSYRTLVREVEADDCEE